MRLPKQLLLLFVAGCMAPAALAQVGIGPGGGGGSDQGGIPTWVEYGKRIEATQRISALENGFAGEEVGLYDGATTFSVTDIDVPGNFALPVRLARRIEIKLQPQDGIQPYDSLLHGVGNWEVDVPYMAATYPTDTGWNADRCSTGSVPPTAMGPNGVFWRAEVWQGIVIHVPGRGDASALGLDTQTPTPSSGGPYHLTTTNRDVFDCIPMKSGLSGEGFRMTTAAGVQYYFDVGTTRTASKLVKYIYISDLGPSKTAVYLERNRYYLLASKIEDRFGNTIQIQYDASGHPTSISASDGRAIALTYSGEQLASATSNGRTWHYYYDPSGNLATVALPDKSQWQYVYTGTLMPSAPPPYESLPLPWCQGVTSIIDDVFTLTATHPSGATASFRFDNLRHYRSGVHASECVSEGDPANPTYDLLAPYFFDVMSLTQKTLSGPGMPTGDTWQYGYSSTPAGLWGSHDQPPNYPCTTCTPYKTTTVTNPDGTEQRYRFGMVYQLNDGWLLQTDTLRTDGTAIRTQASTYLSEAAAGSQPFYAQYGHVLGGVADPITARIRPITQTTITQDGATFTTSVNSFDAFARDTGETQTGTGIGTYDGATSKTVTTNYSDDLAHWVLGLVTKTATNNVVVSQTYYNGLDQPTDQYSFGKHVLTRSWHPADGTDQGGTLASVIDGKGNTTQFSLWHRGLPQAVKFADNTSKSAHVDDNGWIASLTDESGAVTGYKYDPMGRLAEIDYPSDSTNTWNATMFSFAPVNGVEYGIPAGHWKQTVQTGTGVTNTYFDALWRPLVTERYDSANIGGTRSLVVHLYDAVGRTIFTSYPVSNLGQYTDSLPGADTGYDALNRVTTVVQDTELTHPSTTTTDYLPGFKTQVIDPNGFGTTTSYYAWGSPDTSMPYQITSQVSQAATTTTIITRDIFGKPVWIARDGTTYQAFVYDGYQQLCKHVANGIVTFDAWDPAGNLAWSAQGANGFGGDTCADVTQANAAGHVVSRIYDARNRLKTLGFPDGVGNQNWTYTPDGLPYTVVTANGSGPQVTNSYLYDARRLLISEALTAGSQFTWVVGYGYDANGNLSVRFTPSGQYYYTSPDALGQPTMLGIQNVNTYVYNVTHFPDGKIASFRWTNGVTHTVRENVRGLPSEIHDTSVIDDPIPGQPNPDNDVEDLAYTYEADGNPVQITDGADGTRTTSMQYDGLDRLISASITGIANNLPAQYSYNGLGQITGVTQGTHVLTYTYDSNYTDELAQVIDNQNGTTSFGYDAQGNLASRNGVGYTFDVGNRLRNVAGEEGGYAYDAWGRRVAQTDASGTIYSFYDLGGQLIYQRDRAGGTHDYLYLGGKLVAIRDYDSGGIARVWRFQDTDALGSVIRQTDKYGNDFPDTAVVYDAWGGMHGATPQDGPGYTGHVEDADTNLVYMQQRYYDPSVGRLLSMDPVDASGTDGSNLDRYWYAKDNPYRFTDPDGRDITEALGGLFYETASFVTGNGFHGSQIVGALKDGYNGQGGGVGHALLEDAGTVSAAAGIAGAIKGGATLIAARVAAKEAVEEGGELAGGAAKSLKEQAADLVSQNGGKNRVTIESPSQKIEVDLAGKSHGGIETPHVKVSERNLNAPNQPAYNTKSAQVRPATQEDIDMAKHHLDTNGQ
ncbi:MAG: RHS repeat-associated core domain-containing protein [Pseudomonadota bacterium]